MLRSSLTVKIVLVIEAVLILGFGASTLLTIERQHAALLEQSKAEARRVTAVVIAGMETAMLQERPDVTRVLIQELRAAPPVAALDVYRRNGVEAFADLATLQEVERNAGLAEDVFKKIASLRQEPGRPLSGPHFTRALETQQPQESLEDTGDRWLFTIHHPIPNREKCQGCHGADHQVRAVVRVATSLEPVRAAMGAQRRDQLLIGGITILAAGAVLAAAMRSVVVRPIHALGAVARRIGAGDFAARVERLPRDEIGELGGALNDMTARLAAARQDLAARNAELAEAVESLQASRRQVELLEQIRAELGKFVPDAVKALLERDPQATVLEKRPEEVTVVFLDIVGYTRLSEQLEPRQLDRLVQTYFGSFLEIIRARHGDISETAGDGLMVIFQGGRGREDHALNAAEAALAIRRRTSALNEEHAGELPPIELHMGCNTGEALVGATKLGGAGEPRWTFTATGPVTNVAARLAGLAGPGEIVVGPETAARVRQRFVLEALGERALKNVSAPVRCFRLVPPGVYEKIV
jgi:class 3 adenylate cyclase/HAMP domain-containing protein